jgi:hypothetical protein
VIPTGRTIYDLAIGDLKGSRVSEKQLERRFRVGAVKAYELKARIEVVREEIARSYLNRIPARREVRDDDV